MIDKILISDKIVSRFKIRDKMSKDNKIDTDLTSTGLAKPHFFYGLGMQTN